MHHDHALRDDHEPAHRPVRREWEHAIEPQHQADSREHAPPGRAFDGRAANAVRPRLPGVRRTEHG
ncbi:MAG TPA: hypothetical protein VNU71_00210 [Burkholderiaceae bacterium]|nr:hypothetical protein [Burkholderiaceae bacterium]